MTDERPEPALPEDVERYTLVWMEGPTPRITYTVPAADLAAALARAEAAERLRDEIDRKAAAAEALWERQMQGIYDQLAAAEARVREVLDELAGWEEGAAETTRALHASGAYALRLIAAGDGLRARIAGLNYHDRECGYWSDQDCDCSWPKAVAAWERAKGQEGQGD